MNAENMVKQDIGSRILEYQNLVNIADRKLKKYRKATENRDAALEEWEIALKAADEALIALRDFLK